jgi:predicted secreted protein
VVDFLKGFLIYVIIWWIVVFTILPIGIRKQDKIEKGHSDGAPQNPQIIKKFIITSVIAFVLWLVVFYFIKNQVFTFQYN